MVALLFGRKRKQVSTQYGRCTIIFSKNVIFKKLGFLFNSCRSALSLILPGCIGNDMNIRRFLRGIAKKKPIRPKY